MRLFMALPFIIISIVSIYFNFFTEDGSATAYSMLLGAITWKVISDLYAMNKAKKRVDSI